MKRLFDLDAPIIQAIAKLGNLMLANVWWVICCLPLVTAGAATAALHRVAFNIRENKSCTTGDFFRAFGSNFLKGTALWLIMLVLAVPIVCVYALTFSLTGQIAKLIAIGLFCGMLLLWLATLQYVFSLTAYFENTVFATLRNAFALSLRHLRQTIICTALMMIPAVAYLISPEWFLRLLFIWVTVAPGVIVYGKSGQLKTVFSQYAEQPEETEAE